MGRIRHPKTRSRRRRQASKVKPATTRRSVRPGFSASSSRVVHRQARSDFRRRHPRDDRRVDLRQAQSDCPRHQRTARVRSQLRVKKAERAQSTRPATQVSTACTRATMAPRRAVDLHQAQLDFRSHRRRRQDDRRVDLLQARWDCRFHNRERASRRAAARPVAVVDLRQARLGFRCLRTPERSIRSRRHSISQPHARIA
jgi:hypothetical protein